MLAQSAPHVHRGYSVVVIFLKVAILPPRASGGHGPVDDQYDQETPDDDKTDNYKTCNRHGRLSFQAGPVI